MFVNAMRELFKPINKCTICHCKVNQASWPAQALSQTVIKIQQKSYSELGS